MRGLRAIVGLSVVSVVLTVLVVLAPSATAVPDHYRVPSGARFNNPYGSEDSRRAIVRHLYRTISSVKGGQKIRIASWNLRSVGLTNALIGAHRRGVSVRVVMDRSNATVGVPNRDVARLSRALRAHNNKRPAPMRSWLRKCVRSCRGAHGIAHSKFFLFSQVGRAKDVVMYGSANATELSATIQWNDLFTFTNRPVLYSEFEGVFAEMGRDRRVAGGAHRVFRHRNFTVSFYPYTGRSAVGDPVMKALRKVRCKGTTGGAGVGGRTQIRISQTAMYGDRGIALARRLVALRRQGCNIRLVYAMFGNKVLGAMRAARIPMTHLAHDSNDDGIYDRYVHMKSMAISGVYGGRTNASVTFNGSANWTAVALASDEVVGEFHNARITRSYIRWIDFLFTHRPASWGKDTQASGEARVMVRARGNGVDPYALIKRDL